MYDDPLEPCGCGGSADIHRSEDGSVFVKCRKMDCDNHTGNYTFISKAVKVWNKKAIRARRKHDSK